jgi:hypothetical protein
MILGQEVVMKRKLKKAPKRKTAVPEVAAPTIKLLCMPKDGELRPGQAFTILEILNKKGGTLTVPELLKAMEGKIATRNVLGLRDVYYMNRPKLIAGGFVEVEQGGGR